MTATDKIKANIEAIIPLSEQEWNCWAEKISILSIAKNDFFLVKGHICDSIAFVDKGTLIYYRTIDNGNDVTIDFAFEGDWVTDNLSRLSGSPSLLSIKAIEQTELCIIKQADILDLYDKSHALANFGRIQSEQAYIRLAQLSTDLQTLSATDRYLKLLHDQPEIFQKVPLYHIANYLGIAPESLSRIRNSILTDS